MPPLAKSSRVWLAFLGALLLSTCGQSISHTAATPVFHAEGNPPLLSDWGVVSAKDDHLVVSADVIAYDLNTSLFTDYAHKLRTVWLPEGTSANYDAVDTFDFPIGTIISKTFYYPRGPVDGEVLRSDKVETAPLELSTVQLIETRILAHRQDGWVALPYVWDADQKDAQLKRVGDIKQLTLVSSDGENAFNYVVPNANQCAGCHATNATTKKIMPIGPKARHLNKIYGESGVNQLEAWRTAGVLIGGPGSAEAPKAASWFDDSASLDKRARAYLDINCAHCHNNVGPADTSGLHFEPSTKTGVHLGLCKLPIAAGNGTGGRAYDIVPGEPDNSITTYRMQSIKPSEMMPELGRSLAHDEGVELIREWIAALEGSCS